MSLLYIDSFDHYASADIASKWTSQSGGVTIGSTSGRHSSAGLKSNYNGGVWTGQLGKTLPAVGSTFVIGHAFKTDLIPGSGGTGIVQVYDGATAQMTLVLRNDMRLQAFRGPMGGTSLGASSLNALSLNVFCYIEWKVFIDPTNGTVEVRVDGVPMINLINQNTRNSANAVWSQFFLGLVNTTGGVGSSSNKIEMDDVYVLDGTGPSPWNNFLGDVRVDSRFATGAGTNSGWTPSAGANWSCVDDPTPNANTDFVQAVAPGVIDTYVVQDAPVVGGAIYGVQNCIAVTKNDGGACSVAPFVLRSGVQSVGTDMQPPHGGYAYALQMEQVDPTTGAAWLEANFNASEFGFKRTA